MQVGTAYRLAALPDPTAAPIVRLELKATRKRLGMCQKQALDLRYKGEAAHLAEPPKGPCIATLLRVTGVTGWARAIGRCWGVRGWWSGSVRARSSP